MTADQALVCRQQIVSTVSALRQRVGSSDSPSDLDLVDDLRLYRQMRPTVWSEPILDLMGDEGHPALETLVREARTGPETRGHMLESTTPRLHLFESPWMTIDLAPHGALPLVGLAVAPAIRVQQPAERVWIFRGFVAGVLDEAPAWHPAIYWSVSATVNGMAACDHVTRAEMQAATVWSLLAHYFLRERLAYVPLLASEGIRLLCNRCDVSSLVDRVVVRGAPTARRQEAVHP